MTAWYADYDVLPFAERTLTHLLARREALAGDAELYRYEADPVTARQARERAAKLAGALAAAGVQSGDRVVVMSGNRPEMLDLFLACGWLGAMFAPLNIAAKGASLAHMLDNADPALIVAEPASLARIAASDVTFRGVRGVWSLGAVPPDLRIGGVAASAVRMDAAPRAPTPVHPSAPLALLYTSGTTGPAKGVLCSHAQFYWWAVLASRLLEHRQSDTLYTVLPLFHTNALNAFAQALLSGARFVFGARFSASSYWREVGESGATVVYLLGTMAQILLDRPPAPNDRAHRARVTLAPGASPGQVARFQERFGIKVVDGYGSTETNLVLANTLGGDHPGTMGRVVELFEVAIVDDDDQPVPDGTPGEMLVRNREPFLMANGYFRNPEATVAAWRNLWFHTGDRIVRDPDTGIYRFLDRKKDAIRRRGENISSYEVEQALESHPDVATAAAIGVPSPLGEEEVMAFIVPRAGAAPDPVAIVRHVETRLAYFAVPRYLEFIPELPLTDNGKIRKFALRARGLGPATWDREAAGIVLQR
jgi:crotonobetaine/carnitine-CoA ligase